jgi:polyisoprenoid-binding protein YceI
MVWLLPEFLLGRVEFAMPRRVAALCLTMCAAVPALAQVSKDPTQAPSGTYALETAHSQVLFSISHIGLTDFHGRFDRLSGTLKFNAQDPARSAVSIAIDTGSVDTPSDRLNDELMGPTVFDAANAPQATFTSTAIVRTGPSTGTITGDLTIRKVTKPVTLDVVFTGTENNPLGDSRVLGFHATATIKRTDFGITGMVWEPMVGDEVTLTIEAMFNRENEKP